MSSHRRAPEIAPFGEPLWHTRPTAAYYNDSHIRLRDTVRAYVSENITPNCAEWEEQGFVPAKVLAPLPKYIYIYINFSPDPFVGPPRTFPTWLHGCHRQSRCHRSLSWEHQTPQRYQTRTMGRFP
jgi:hypothetical protein